MEETTLLSVYLKLQTTKGVFIGERGTKGSVQSRASNLGTRLHNVAAKMWHLLHFRGNAWEARVAPPAALSSSVPLSAGCLCFGVWVPDFDKITSKVNGYLL